MKTSIVVAKEMRIYQATLNGVSMKDAMLVFTSQVWFQKSAPCWK